MKKKRSTTTERTVAKQSARAPRTQQAREHSELKRLRAQVVQLEQERIAAAHDTIAKLPEAAPLAVRALENWLVQVPAAQKLSLSDVLRLLAHVTAAILEGQTKAPHERGTLTIKVKGVPFPIEFADWATPAPPPMLDLDPHETRDEKQE